MSQQYKKHIKTEKYHRNGKPRYHHFLPHM